MPLLLATRRGITESEITLLRAEEEQARFTKQTEQDQMEVGQGTDQQSQGYLYAGLELVPAGPDENQREYLITDSGMDTRHVYRCAEQRFGQYGRFRRL